MARFVVVENHNGKYNVRDTLTGMALRFGYNNPPLYASKSKPADEWNNYHSALGFAQKMETKNAAR